MGPSTCSSFFDLCLAEPAMVSSRGFFMRYWTAGGMMRNVLVGAGRCKNKNLASHNNYIVSITSVKAMLCRRRLSKTTDLQHPNSTYLLHTLALIQSSAINGIRVESFLRFNAKDTNKVANKELQITIPLMSNEEAGTISQLPKVP
ncbi:hypothetical protein Bca101_067649 [Brassica carinata]